MSILYNNNNNNNTAAGPVVLHEQDVPGWSLCPYCVLDRLYEVTKEVRDQLPWCDAPEYLAARIVLGNPAQA